jgi:hypothetical protein
LSIISISNIQQEIELHSRKNADRQTDKQKVTLEVVQNALFAISKRSQRARRAISFFGPFCECIYDRKLSNLEPKSADLVGQNDTAAYSKSKYDRIFYKLRS